MEVNNRRNSTLLILGIGTAFVLVILFQYYSRSNESPYDRAIAQQRANKDLQFKEAADSPIKAEEKERFEGLVYFTPDERYKVETSFIPNPQADTLSLMTTSGTERRMIQAGALQFSLQGLEHRLLAYRYLDPAIKELFVPFKDLTSGGDTYGGGRYLDIPWTAGQTTFEVDFNKAYHPYCVYNEEFVCPLPPSANKLQIEVRAGERLGEW
jgi:uncharacterized protein (DUF1684 family)